MKKIMIVILLISLVLLTGCINKTESMCGVLKHTNNPNVKVYMDGNLCIIEGDNYTESYYVECSTLLEYGAFIFKINEEKLGAEFDETFSKLKRKCKVMDLN